MSRLIRATEALLHIWIGRCRRQREMADERRWEEIEAGLGSISETGHVWDRDPLDWAQRLSG